MRSTYKVQITLNVLLSVFINVLQLFLFIRGFRTFLPTQRMGSASGEAWAEIFRFRSNGHRRTSPLLRMSILQRGCAQGPGKTINNLWNDIDWSDFDIILEIIFIFSRMFMVVGF